MFNIKVSTVTTFGNNFNNSKIAKKINVIKEIFRTNSDFIIVEHYMKKMQANAQSTVVKRTGNLMRNIKIAKTGTGWVFYVDNKGAPYGPYIEKGTSRMPPRPYFEPSIAKFRDPLRKALINYFRGKAVSGR